MNYYMFLVVIIKQYKLFFCFVFSLRGLSVNDAIVVQSPSEHPVNYDAGADLLHKYQTEWNQLHLLAEDNAHKAEVCIILK